MTEIKALMRIEQRKFRISSIDLVKVEIEQGIFKKVHNDIYSCDIEYDYLIEKYINEGHILPYIPEQDLLRSSKKYYAVEEGRFMLYECKNKIKDGKLSPEKIASQITDNFYIILDEDVEFDNGIEMVHKWRGRIIVNESREFKFDIDARLFANPQDMAKILVGIGGAKVVFDNAKLKDIRNAMLTTSDYVMRKVSQIFGWNSDKVYHTQSSMIIRGVVKKFDGGNVDLSDIGHARHLDMITITNNEFKIVGNSILKDLMNMHERYPIDCLFGFTFLAPISSQIMRSNDWSGGRVGMWIVGGSGCGKTYTSLLFQNFFGDFKGEKSVFTWLGTPYSIQEGGYHFKDAIYMVDDFKIAHFPPSGLNSAVMVLQNYADGTARTRLGQDLNLREGKPIRGSLLITGEDILDEVASVMARYHVVEMDKNTINRDAGRSAYKHRKLYNGFMGRYIAWILEDPKYVDKIVRRIERVKDRFIGNRDSANIDRVAQSFAYNLVGFEMFCQFINKSGFVSLKKSKEMIKIHKKNLLLHIDKNVMGVKAATVSEVFMSTLADLINSGAVRIYNVKPNPPSYGVKDEYIGFDDFDEYLYFWGIPTWNAVNKAVGSGKGLMNSKTNLISELIKKEIMIPGITGNTYPKLLHGKTQVTWRILKSALGYDIEVDEDDEDW